jgi:hypothetical protein
MATLWSTVRRTTATASGINPDGSIGVGCKMRIVEMPDRKPEYMIDCESVITRLDPGGFAHEPSVRGVPIAEANYTFERAPEGTIYRNNLIIGFETRPARWANRLVPYAGFNDEHAIAWIKHNVEEVGNFESFLPRLYAAEMEKDRVRSPVKARVS